MGSFPFATNRGDFANAFRNGSTVVRETKSGNVQVLKATGNLSKLEIRELTAAARLGKTSN